MDSIIQLITDYKVFTEQLHSEDPVLFGEWLKQKYAPPTNYLTDDDEVNEAGLDVVAAYLLGGLTSYMEAWVKLTYQDLPILSLGDFAIIKSVQYLQHPRKKDIMNQTIMERTTCMESIKRLIKVGILKEYNDEKDKRVKRVLLTSMGKELVVKLDQKMMHLSVLLMGDLSEIEKKSLLSILQKLNTFHAELYQKRQTIDIKQQYEL